MGIIIRVDTDAVEKRPMGLLAGFPLPLLVTLECDLAGGLFCRRYEDFRSDEGFPSAHAEAMKAGWLERQASQGRLWICPTCSGKRSRTQ